MTSAEGSRHVGSARMGKATEYLVAASCILASRARLNVSTALVDDEGVDLVFNRRNGTATLAVQVKARMSDSVRVRKGSFVAFVGLKTFRPRPDLYMLFLPVDVEAGSYEFAWLVPSIHLAEGAGRSGERLRFFASLNPERAGKWSRYRVSRATLPHRILEVLSDLDGE
jgi:hypothetical protein